MFIRIVKLVFGVIRTRKIPFSPVCTLYKHNSVGTNSVFDLLSRQSQVSTRVEHSFYHESN